MALKAALAVETVEPVNMADTEETAREVEVEVEGMAARCRR